MDFIVLSCWPNFPRTKKNFITLTNNKLNKGYLRLKHGSDMQMQIDIDIYLKFLEATGPAKGSSFVIREF